MDLSENNQKAFGLYQTILQEAKLDPRVTAFLLTGSRAMDLETSHSDFDFEIIIDDLFEDAVPKWTGRLRRASMQMLEIDGRAMTFAQLERASEWGAHDSWNRFALSRARVEFDRSGYVQQVLDVKATIPLGDRAAFIDISLDHVINQLYRSVKCLRAGNVMASRLEGAEMINPYLDAVFALHNGRLRPYPKYLESELSRSPLHRLELRNGSLLGSIMKVLSDGDYQAQQELVIAIEKLARLCGHGEVFDSWKGKDKWAMTICL